MVEVRGSYIFSFFFVFSQHEEEVVEALTPKHPQNKRLNQALGCLHYYEHSSQSPVAPPSPTSPPSASPPEHVTKSSWDHPVWGSI